ncbi:Phosphoglycerate dehydrogenase [Paenibacillus sp. 1_12]|uniref:hydroxyacid dehydrogenase n=1 Tax=Paenibacillus sp. 1_12 TaxID=1566278 RepID=UPI0008E0AA00|nr:hydroxyacid dehydrogenase [Paenibacillus sp. 1_12]SFL36272.1 Phosphoglycerate dehydrogenase [Paenibacillus sp. 1_12]
MGKPKALILPPQSRLDEVCSDACRSLINEQFDPVWNETGADYTQEELAALIESAEVILTSWGSPSITEEMLERAPKLRMIGHAAGTVKGRIPPTAFSKQVRIFSAAPRIAHSVGEYCLTVLMSSLRHMPTFDKQVKAGQWRVSSLKGRELAGQTIGMVSASSTARAFLKLLAPFHVNVLVYDPYLKDEAAALLKVTKASLEEVMRCPIISIHAPKLPATYKMVTKDMIASIPDDAILINSSRADVLDEEALIEELQKGRFFAALDVFTKEPLPADHPLTKLDNVLLSSHVAGATVQGHLALMEGVVEDILKGLRQEQTSLEVTQAMWENMA